MNGMWILSLIAFVAVYDAATACKMTHSSALSQIQSVGIGIHSSGGCSNREQKTCTSLEQVICNTIACIRKLKTSSNCPMTITGGTEVGHTPGTYSHYNGYKIDISLNSCIEAYIKNNFRYVGLRSDNSPLYRAANGNEYAKEGNHWDITFTATC